MTAAATVLFAACQKTEVVYNEGPQEIAMFAVNNLATKAPVADAKFLDGDNMTVAAYNVTGSANYFPGTPFTNAGETWKGNPTRYWPISTGDVTLSFLAVTETGGGNDKSSTTFDTTTPASKATVVLHGNNIRNQNDLMYAVGQETHTTTDTYPKVELKFKHALSWINFTVNTNVSADVANITVKSITLNNAVTDGTLEVVYSNYDKKETPNVTATWITRDEGANLLVPNADGTAKADAVPVVKGTATTFGNGILVLPSTNTNPSATGFTVVYEMAMNGGVASQYTYTYEFDTKPVWAMAYKYIYNISINLTEIEVEPTVKTWELADGITADLN